MTWLTPLYAGIAAAVAIPTLLILYFLKLRRRDVEVSTTLLWKKAIQDLQANAPFQKLRRNILLILQLLVLAGLLAALGQPQVKRQAVTGARHVILIDRSASMNATDEDDGRGGSITRFEAAKRQAVALVESLREGGLLDQDRADEAMVIAFDTQAEIRQQMTSDKAALRRAIESITPTEAPTAIEEAVRLALAQKPRRVEENVGLTTGPPVTFHVYSDGRIPDAATAAPSPDDSVEFHRLGTVDAANASIVGMRAERSFENPNRLSVYVSLENTQPRPRTVDVELLIDGVGAGIKPTTIPGASGDGLGLSGAEAARAASAEAATRAAAGVAPPADEESVRARPIPGTSGVVFSLERGQGAVVQVRLRDPGTGAPLVGDVLTLDDAAFLVVPPAKKLAVAVVSAKGNLFLSSALQGLPLSKLSDLTPAMFQQRVLDGTLGEYDVVILDGWLPEGARAKPLATPTPESGQPAGTIDQPVPLANAKPEDLLPPGRYIIFGEVPQRLGRVSAGLKDLGPGGAASIVDWRRDHPLLRAVNLDGLDIARSRGIEVETGSPATVLASSDRGPIILEASTNEVRAVIVPFDIAESDWPFNVSFVVFLASATGYLADETGAGASGRVVQPGSVLSDRLPGEVADVTVKLPDGKTQKLRAASDGRIVFGPLAASGVYAVSWTGPFGPTDVEGDDGRPTRYYAANLFDRVESDVGAAAQVELASRVVESRAEGSAIADRNLWPWLCMAALVIIMLEWFVYNRKVHV
ncbi:MAG: lipoprotein [Phycisphaerae bacterium]|nr:MAG: lipoprotein [Phycisphaerae bacterium]